MHTANLRPYIDHHGDRLFYVDVQGQIAYVNEPCCKYLGYSRDELIARDVAALDVRVANDEFMDRAGLRQRGQPTRFEAVIRHKDGTAFPVEIDITHAPYGNRMLLRCELRDVARRRQVLRRMADRHAMANG